MRVFGVGLFLCAFVFLQASAAWADPPQESVVLAQVVGDRLKKALADQPYTITKVCTAQDCSLIIEPK